MMLMILALCCQQAKQPFLAGDWSCAVPTRPDDADELDVGVLRMMLQLVTPLMRRMRVVWAYSCAPCCDFCTPTPH